MEESKATLQKLLCYPRKELEPVYAFVVVGVYVAVVARTKNLS